MERRTSNIAAYLANTNTQRHFWLYDTFDGMTRTIQHDYKIKQKTSLDIALILLHGYAYRK